MSGVKVVKSGGRNKKSESGKNDKSNKPKGIDAEVAQDDIARRIDEDNPEKPLSENSSKPEEKQTGTATNEGFLKGLQNAAKDGEETSNKKAEPTNEETIKSLMDRALKAEKQAQAYKDRITELEKNVKDTSEAKAKEEPQVNNSGTTEETVTPETKTNSEPQATQEPAKEANTTSGTGEATADNMMTPEDAYNYFKNKDNYEKASNVFETPSFNEYIDNTTGKWIPRGYFDAFNAKDGINPKKFTFEHFKAKIPEDLSKKLTSAEATEELARRNAALKSYEDEYKKFNTGFQAYLRKHPKLANALKWGLFGAAGEGAVEFGKWLNETYMAGQNDKDELQNTEDWLNNYDDDLEYPGSNNDNNNSPENIAAQLKGADESTETPEDNSGTIEQAIAEQTPAGNVEPENPQVAANAVTSTNTKANNAPASTAKSAPTQDLPPVVTRDAPPANPDSSGMTYSQLVEMGQAPQAGSMTYNANNPDMVTANLINAMNQNPQAGSDAIGYGDLYDQNFIDFWAKRNPNLAYAVSQGRKS